MVGGDAAAEAFGLALRGVEELGFDIGADDVVAGAGGGCGDRSSADAPHLSFTPRRIDAILMAILVGVSVPLPYLSARPYSAA